MRSASRLLLLCWLAGGLGSLPACGAGSAPAKQPTTPPAAQAESPARAEAEPAVAHAPPASEATATGPAPSDAAAQPEDDAPLPAPSADLEKLPVEAPLAAEVNAGVIPRGLLEAVLAQGISRFLQDVRTEPEIVKGRFAGWRILSLFPRRSDVHVAVLRPGDTVRRANGQSIERPEAFKSVWDSMATANELVLDIERAGRPSKLRYTIAD